jgi:hypothetical protein
MRRLARVSVVRWSTVCWSQSFSNCTDMDEIYFPDSQAVKSIYAVLLDISGIPRFG